MMKVYQGPTSSHILKETLCKTKVNYTASLAPIQSCIECGLAADSFLRSHNRD